MSASSRLAAVLDTDDPAEPQVTKALDPQKPGHYESDTICTSGLGGVAASRTTQPVTVRPHPGRALRPQGWGCGLQTIVASKNGEPLLPVADWRNTSLYRASREGCSLHESLASASAQP